ncbi:hypothetical protein [Leucobacter japonicus]|uniref:hypothetical protein n=1 Tax=Leucobacter japonicus TaxID=1461259 RepID=UPI0006A7AAA1|nr:hypothetical protein [Leucobacter japonicus]
MPKRDHSKHTDPTAVMVRIVVADDGTLTLTVDGAPYLPPEFSPPWRRASFPAIVDAISRQTGRTLRVDVIETDGRTITDFYTPRSPRRGDPQTPAAESSAQVAAAVEPAPAPPRLMQFAGSGMIPGEEVAVAVIIAHAESGPDGIARALIDSRYLEHSPTGEAVLLGRISATVCVGQPQ